MFTTCIFELALGSVVFIGGLGLMVSAAKGHKYVSDPPEGAWWFYSQSLVWSNNAGRASRLEETLDGWRYTNSDGAIEIYDTEGLLKSITTASGSVQLLSYDESNRLVRVESERGDWITLTYDDANRLSTLRDQAERVWSYSYDEVGNLVAAQLPDGRNRAYHYNELTHTSGIDLPHALTGITDERGVRYASFEYASDGRAIASYHALNANKITVSYHDETESRTVQNSRGGVTSLDVVGQQGVALVRTISGPGCSSCGL